MLSILPLRVPRSVILPLRVPRSVLLTLWCPKLRPLRGLKQTSSHAALLVLKDKEVLQSRGRRVDGVIMRTRKPPHPQKTKLKKFGVWGRNRDQLTIFIFFLKFIAGSSLGIGCRLDLRKTKKPAERRVLRSSEALGVPPPWTSR